MFCKLRMDLATKVALTGTILYATGILGCGASYYAYTRQLSAPHAIGEGRQINYGRLAAGSAYLGAAGGILANLGLLLPRSRRVKHRNVPSH